MPRKEFDMSRKFKSERELVEHFIWRVRNIQGVSSEIQAIVSALRDTNITGCELGELYEQTDHWPKVDDMLEKIKRSSIASITAVLPLMALLKELKAKGDWYKCDPKCNLYDSLPPGYTGYWNP
jgi:hypothetical protein